MKKILITGKNSYVGNSFKEWIETKYSDDMTIEVVGMKNGDWENISFKNYDTILHVAGIAHVSKNKKMEQKYYEVNTELTIKVATKAKNEGVKHFIFLSSIIVYGKKNREITETTIPDPDNFYGNSKLLAEKKLKVIENNDFKVSIIRPPMIYGKKSKGNYPKLSKLSSKIMYFPYVDNKRSMIYVDNLSEFLYFIVNKNSGGLYFPQNKEYVNTSALVKQISKSNGKNIRLIYGFDKFLKHFCKYSYTLNKVFGNLIYDQKMSEYEYKYQKVDFNKSIELTEREEK